MVRYKNFIKNDKCSDLGLDMATWYNSNEKTDCRVKQNMTKLRGIKILHGKSTVD